jgi:3-phenylpropionate/cinnamic acid dioxygenase small subunit
VADSEVRHTLYRYCRLLDERDLDALMAQVYLPNAMDDRRRGKPLTGHQEIRAYFERAFVSVAATAHLLSNVEVTITGDHAVAHSRVTAYHWTYGGEPARPADFVLIGTYDDELMHTADGWRISRRVVGALGPAGLVAGALPEIFAGFGGHDASSIT